MSISICISIRSMIIHIIAYYEISCISYVYHIHVCYVCIICMQHKPTGPPAQTRAHSLTHNICVYICYAIVCVCVHILCNRNSSQCYCSQTHTQAHSLRPGRAASCAASSAASGEPCYHQYHYYHYHYCYYLYNIIVSISSSSSNSSSSSSSNNNNSSSMSIMNMIIIIVTRYK